MKKAAFLLLPATTAILAACGGSSPEGSSGTRRIAATADIQKEGIQYFEVTAPSSQERVLTAYDAKDAAVFSVDYVSDAAHTQRTITLTGPRVFHTWTIAAARPAEQANGANSVHIEMSRECGYYYRELVIAFVTNDWEDFGFWADSISAFCSDPLVA
jgi:hypothetical protein